MPSLAATRIWLPTTPIVTISLRFLFAVRSGLIAVHESPLSVERKTRLAATYSTPELCGENTIGVSQLKRRLWPSAAGITLAAVGRMLFDSPVILFLRAML